MYNIQCQNYDKYNNCQKKSTTKKSSLKESVMFVKMLVDPADKGDSFVKQKNCVSVL